ncbi:MAG: hypothetical protein ACRBBV_15160 [Paracoccaceae bacterium]
MKNAIFSALAVTLIAGGASAMNVEVTPNDSTFTGRDYVEQNAKGLSVVEGSQVEISAAYLTGRDKVEDTKGDTTAYLFDTAKGDTDYSPR